MEFQIDMDQKSDKQDNSQTLNVWSLASELGFLIAIPLVIFILIGVKLDKTFGTTPLFIILGMILAFVLSATSIVRKVKKLDKMNK